MNNPPNPNKSELVLCRPSHPAGWENHSQLAVSGEAVYYGQGALCWGPMASWEVPQEAWDASDVVASGEWVPVEEE